MRKMFKEDVDRLFVLIQEWAEGKGLDLVEEEWSTLEELIEDELDPFHNGYQNYN